MARCLRTIAILGLPAAVACGCALPEGVPGSPSESCLQARCHDAVENAHYGSAPGLRCVDCHGGDDEAADIEEAHVTIEWSFNPSTPGSRFLDSPSLDELDGLPREVVRFLNPSDYRVAGEVCGTNAAGGTECHSRITESSLMLNRATLAGQVTGGGFLSGAWDKQVRYGVTETTDPFHPEEIPDGWIAGIERLPAEAPEEVAGPLARSFYPVLEQLCVDCHLGRDGPRAPGLYYSSGCAGCHMPAEDDGRPATRDETQDAEELGHPLTHRLVNLVPDGQCAHCHVSHLGRPLLSQGIRERSEPEGDTLMGGVNHGIEDPEHARPWAEMNYVAFQGRSELYGKPFPFFIDDEDSTNMVDETPPDIHVEKSLRCIDCHNIREAHGTDGMATRMDHETDVRCETCHGRPGEYASLRSDAGLAFSIAQTAVGGSGANTPVFGIADDGVTIVQRGRFSGALHHVTQITRDSDPADPLFNPRTRMGCELHSGTAERRRALKDEVNALAASDPGAGPVRFPGLAAGFTFDVPEAESDGRVECFACHNAWTVNCYGCHIVRDDREEYVSRIDGETRHGRVTSYPLTVVSDQLSLGLNARGRVSPMLGTSIFFTHLDEAGNSVFDAQALVDGEGNSGDGNVHNPVHHHTTRQQPRDCDGCHPSASGSHDELDLLTAVGFGSGRYLFSDGDGRVHLLDRTLLADYDGDGAWEDPLAAGLPGHVAAVRAIASSTHAAIGPQDGQPGGPGPLDLDAVNRLLGSLVMPQRPVQPR